MRITKYEHACLVLEKGETKLVIDPCDMTRNLNGQRGVVAVVFTHAHYDHFSIGQAEAIAASNPDVQFIGTSEVAAALPGRPAKVVAAGDDLHTGPFELRFYGHQHTPVQGKNVGQNVGVLVDDAVYYPGDSYDMPNDGRRPKLLALGVSGPWFTVEQSIAALRACAPTTTCLPTHDGFVGEPGTPTVTSWLPEACAAMGIKLAQLQPGESLELQD